MHTLNIRLESLHSSHIVLQRMLQDAVGERVTVVLQSGQAIRVALPFAPAGPLPKLALDALQRILPSGLYHSLASKHLLTPGVCSPLY